MLIVNPTTTRGYLQAVSGLFITKEHPGGLTPKEIDIITAFLFVMKDEDGQITPEDKDKVATLLNHPRQVVTNYVKKLRDKGVLTITHRFNPIIRKNEILIRKQEQDNV